MGTTAQNLLKGNCYAKVPNQKWATDITEFKVGKDRLYLSPIIDLCTKEIISYALDTKADFKLVMNMLDKAFKKHNKLSELILHLDQGWHYRMYGYRKRLQQKGILQSMLRKATPRDNAVMENFFGILKTEFFYLQHFKDIEHLQIEIKRYINYYNNKRIKVGLKAMTLKQFRCHINNNINV